MFTAFDKAAAAAIGTAFTSLLAAITTLEPELIGAIGTLVTAGLVWLVPNRSEGTRP